MNQRISKKAKLWKGWQQKKDNLKTVVIQNGYLQIVFS